MKNNHPYVSIVDYGLGNLFSIKKACEYVGLEAMICGESDKIDKASGLILPGVGAFGEAMNHLQKLGLIDTIASFAKNGKPFLGICLGMQLLMERSFEFGEHEGLGIVKGDVLSLELLEKKEQRVKIPHIGWSGVESFSSDYELSFLKGIPTSSAMYFVHSYYCDPKGDATQLCKTQFGDQWFCSGLKLGNIEAYQFHPEKSGSNGLKIYANFASKVLK